MSNPAPPSASFPAMHLRVGYQDGNPLTEAQLDTVAGLGVVTDGTGNTQQLTSVRIGPNAWLTNYASGLSANGDLWVTNNAYYASGAWYSQDFGFPAYAVAITESGVFFYYAPPASGPVTWSQVSAIGQNGLPVASVGTALANRGAVAIDGATIQISGQGVISVITGNGGVALYNDPRITGAEQRVNKGVAGGYAGLDGGGKVPLVQLPSQFTPQTNFIFAGTWNASTNTPALASGVGTAGTIYVVTTAGTTALDGTSTWQVNDWVFFSGGAWHRAVGAQQTPYQAPWASVSRSVPSRLMETISVCDFMSAAQLADWQAGTALVDQSSAMTAAVAYASSIGAPAGCRAKVTIPPGTYLIQNSIIVSDYVSIHGYGAKLVGGITAAPYIATGTTPTVPAATDWQSQTAGACFTDHYTPGGATGNQDVDIRGVDIVNFRYGMCIRGDHWINSEFVDVGFAQVNIGVFVYYSSQALQIIYPRCINTNTLFVANATCIVSGHPYDPLPDAQACPGLRIVGGTYQQNCFSNPALDTWFSAAIMRPAASDYRAGAYMLATVTTTQYVSGRAIYIPNRQNLVNQGINYMHIEDLYVDFATSGYILIIYGTQIVIKHLMGEVTFSDFLRGAGAKNKAPYTEACIVIGYCNGAVIEDVQTDAEEFDANDRPACIIMDLGGNTNVRLSEVSAVVGIPDVAWGIASSTPATGAYNALTNAYGGVADTNYAGGTLPFINRMRNVVAMGGLAAVATISDLNATTGQLVLAGNYRGFWDESSGAVLMEGFAGFELPCPSPLNGTETDMRVYVPAASPVAMAEFSGLLEVYLKRLDTGAVDFGTFLIILPPKPVGDSVVTLIAAGVSGHSTVTVAPSYAASSLAPGTTILIGSDPYVIKDFNSSTNVVTLKAPLRANYTSGTVVGAAASVTVRQAFTATGAPWVIVSIPFGNVLNFHSNLGTSVPLGVRLKAVSVGSLLWN